ncbi:hypothetical protein GCM10027296_27470 [Chitinimonas naiadis]
MGAAEQQREREQGELGSEAHGMVLSGGDPVIAAVWLQWKAPQAISLTRTSDTGLAMLWDVQAEVQG